MDVDDPNDPLNGAQEIGHVETTMSKVRRKIHFEIGHVEATQVVRSPNGKFESVMIGEGGKNGFGRLIVIAEESKQRPSIAIPLSKVTRSISIAARVWSNFWNFILPSAVPPSKDDPKVATSVAVKSDPQAPKLTQPPQLSRKKAMVKGGTGFSLPPNSEYSSTVAKSYALYAPSTAAIVPFYANNQGQTKPVEVEMDEKRRIWEEIAKQRQEEKRSAGPCDENPGVLTPSTESVIAEIAVVTQSNYACDVSNVSANLLQQYTDPTSVLRSGKVTQAIISIVIQDSKGTILSPNILNNDGGVLSSEPQGNPNPQERPQLQRLEAELGTIMNDISAAASVEERTENSPEDTEHLINKPDGMLQPHIMEPPIVRPRAPASWE
jgi:hypothetical protein